MEILIVASVSITVVHSLAPDHYLPFVAIGKARKWSAGKTLALSGIAGTVHVLTSIILGMLLILGIDLLGFAEAVERSSPLLLIAIGIGCAILSVIKGHHHAHSASTLMLLLILGLSPCVPLIPLMLAARTAAEIVGVAASFAVATISTIVALRYLSYKAFKPPEFLRRREDLVAGLIIAAVGVLNYLIETKHESHKA
ncbi:hypothetical protein DRP07_00575 [Archaeoglobales archaeon]|nr:MAG: hypothetical protein DRP07_00575 [Archaeoglobales archaeon]